MKHIKVLVVDDSAFMRKLITDILQADPGIQVVATARNGKDALDVIPTIQPDVITLDVEMPQMDGITCLREIVKRHTIPVIMLSSLTQDGADKTIEALEIGAFDFVGKPSGSISLNLGVVGDLLRSKVVAAAEHRLSPKTAQSPTTKPIVQTIHRMPKVPNVLTVPTGSAEPTRMSRRPDLIAIGTSTGGPRALQTVITELPVDIPPVVIVQHMPAGFTKSLATRLNHLSKIDVCETEDGQPLQSGKAYIAPGGSQFEVVVAGHGFRAKISSSPPVNGHRPSVDVLFRSLAAIPKIHVRAAILTGMGSDGAGGMADIHQAGGFTIAEAEESCVVFGMPRAAIAKGCIDAVVPIQRVAAELTNYRRNV